MATVYCGVGPKQGGNFGSGWLRFAEGWGDVNGGLGRGVPWQWGHGPLEQFCCCTGAFRSICTRLHFLSSEFPRCLLALRTAFGIVMIISGVTQRKSSPFGHSLLRSSGCHVTSSEMHQSLSALIPLLRRISLNWSCVFQLLNDVCIFGHAHSTVDDKRT